MKFTAASSLLSVMGLAAAVPTAQPSGAPEQPAAFSVMAARSASPIHLLPLNARGLSFYLGGNTTTYCPLQSGCPPGKNTAFAGNGAALDVVVPGGQQVYVAPSGALQFTQAHSASTPPGSSYGPFEYEASTTGQVFGYWTYKGQGTDGFMACPTDADASEWQVYGALQNATVPTGDVNDCLGFSALAVPTNQTGQTWQYI